MKGLMLRLGLLGTILLLTAHPVTAQRTVRLEVGDGGYLFVRGTLPDSSPVRFMLDTGAGINTVSRAILDRLGTVAKPAGSHTGTRHNGEKITAPVWSIPSIAVGGYRKSNVIVGEFAPSGADGLLSLDFFRDQPMTMDLRDSTLVIETPEHVREIARNAAVVPLRIFTNGPHELAVFVNVCVGSTVRAQAEFDTGAGFNMLMLAPQYMDSLSLHPPKGERGPLEYYLYSTFLPEAHYCEAPSVGTKHQFVGFKQGLIYEALIGHGAFRDRRVTIDIAGKRMLVW